MLLLLAASLFMVEPAPLEMPRAEAYLVREDGRRRLEDRFHRADLWESQSVDGRWTDADGRIFLLAGLRTLPPPEGTEDASVTRRDFRGALPVPKYREPKTLREAIVRLSGLDVAEEGRPARQLPRGYADVDYWEGTNRLALVCAFRPEKSRLWHLAVWLLVDGDDTDRCREAFEERFLVHEFKDFAATHPEVVRDGLDERELLRADARHSVAAYPDWRVTDAPEFVVLDELPSGGTFVRTLTNELALMRARYAATLPTELDGTNALCVARLYATREDYQEALALDGVEGLDWSAAYWCPNRRELVAHLGEGGERELLKTFRHEAFHQYLSYATAMISVSPWLNEGYAQYFEAGPDGPETDACLAGTTPDDLETLSEALPAVMAMDYAEFYGGGDRLRTAKYRLALSIAVFLERGAPKVRFEPFKDFKRDYFEALFKTQDMRMATMSAFASTDRIKLFAAEWTKFWKSR